MNTLRIDTSNKDEMKFEICVNKKKSTKIVMAQFKQAELLIYSLDELLKTKNVSITDFNVIDTNNIGESFTSLRIGVTSVNAINYAIGVNTKANNGEIQIIKPEYIKSRSY